MRRTAMPSLVSKKKFLRSPNCKMSTRFLFSKMSWSGRNHSDRKFSENI